MYRTYESNKNQNNNWLILSASNWNDLQVSNHFFSKELANKGIKVNYVESPGIVGLNLERIFKIIINNFLRRKINLFNKDQNLKNNYNLKNQNLIIIKKILIPILGLPFVDNCLFGLFRNNINNLSNLIKNADNILVCSPIWIRFLKSHKILNYQKNIYYHLVDDVETYKHLYFYLNELKYFLNKIDGIISPNNILLEKYSKYNNNSFIMLHGFSKVLESKKYLNINNRERSIVYAGTFADWCDYDLISKICYVYNDIKIYMIGRPSKNISKTLLSKLEKKYSNLIIKESLDRNKLHQFLLKCSVSIIPYKANDLHIKFSSPSKIMDYIGCGLPVISSDINYCAHHPFVEIARNSEEFIKKIYNALEIDDTYRLEMTNYALANQWNINVEKLLNLLKKND